MTIIIIILNFDFCFCFYYNYNSADPPASNTDDNVTKHLAVAHTEEKAKAVM